MNEQILANEKQSQQIYENSLKEEKENINLKAELLKIRSELNSKELLVEKVSLQKEELQKIVQNGKSQE